MKNLNRFYTPNGFKFEIDDIEWTEDFVQVRVYKEEDTESTLLEIERDLFEDYLTEIHGWKNSEDESIEEMFKGQLMEWREYQVQRYFHHQLLPLYRKFDPLNGFREVVDALNPKTAQA